MILSQKKKIQKYKNYVSLYKDVYTSLVYIKYK